MAALLKVVRVQCCELAAKLADDMQREDLKAKTLTLKLKPPTFEVWSLIESVAWLFPNKLAY